MTLRYLGVKESVPAGMSTSWPKSSGSAIGTASSANERQRKQATGTVETQRKAVKAILLCTHTGKGQSA